MSSSPERRIALVTSPKNSGLSVSLPVILAAGRPVSGTMAPDCEAAADRGRA